jgi:hypothetical protein
LTQILILPHLSKHRNVFSNDERKAIAKKADYLVARIMDGAEIPEKGAKWSEVQAARTSLDRIESRKVFELRDTSHGSLHRSGAFEERVAGSNVGLIEIILTICEWEFRHCSTKI